MEFKKCERCGCFFVSNNNICDKCTPKDESEITRLKVYFDEYTTASSLEEISSQTGITVKNLNRHINADDFKDVSKSLKNNDSDGFNNLSINL